MHTTEELLIKAEQLRQLLAQAIAALENRAILDALVSFALDNPRIAWDPAALAAFALSTQRELDPQAAASGSPLPVKTLLPGDPAASGGAGAGVTLSAPPRLIW